MTDNMKPVAWMRRWKHDGVEGTKGDRPRGWKLKGITDVKALDDDVPLYTADQVKELKNRARNEALEEAAKTVEGNGPVTQDGIGTEIRGWLDEAVEAIRALKDQPHD
jgi:hypothetical protein